MKIVIIYLIIRYNLIDKEILMHLVVFCHFYKLNYIFDSLKLFRYCIRDIYQVRWNKKLIIKAMDGIIVAKEYKLLRKLGSGAFGEVYLAVNERQHTEVAVKLQKSSTKSPQLFYEAKILGSLSPNDSTVDYGFPHVYHATLEGQYNVMVMDLCGKSLEDIFNSNGKKFDLKTTLMVAHQMLERIEFVHTRGFIHRDVKPDNFVIGHGRKAENIYMIDFGLAKKFLNKDGSHIIYKDNKNLTGTARFASLNTHLGIEQGRRDDIEGIANVLLYFIKGFVPWQNLKAANKKEKYQKIMEKKLSIPLEKLCDGLLDEFKELFLYSRTLEFEEKPDYDFLKKLFINALAKEGFDYDRKYCWT